MLFRSLGGMPRACTGAVLGAFLGTRGHAPGQCAGLGGMPWPRTGALLGAFLGTRGHAPGQCVGLGGMPWPRTGAVLGAFLGTRGHAPGQCVGPGGMPWPRTGAVLGALCGTRGHALAPTRGATMEARHGLALGPSFAQSAQGPLKSVKSAPAPLRPCALRPVKDYNAREGARRRGRAVIHNRSSRSGRGRGGGHHGRGQGTSSITFP